MSPSHRSHRVALSSPPNGAIVVPGQLEDYTRDRRSNREESLRAEGFTQAVTSAAKALDTASAALEDQRQQMVESLTETAAGLAVEIVKELLRVELVAENYDIVSIVRETLTAAGSSPGKTVVHVNPEDAEKLKEISFRAGTQIEADPALRRGDVQIETHQGLLVREIDACAEQIRDRIRAEVTSC